MAGDDGFRIDFTFPGPGGIDCRMQLRDISVGGMSFALTTDLPGFDFGTHVEDARVQMGGTVVRGEFVVVHLSTTAAGAVTCGVLFYPSTDADLTAVKDVLDGLS